MSRIAAIDFAEYVNTNVNRLKSSLRQADHTIHPGNFEHTISECITRLPVQSAPVTDPGVPTADPELEYLKTFYETDPDKEGYNCIRYTLYSLVGTFPTSGNLTVEPYGLKVNTNFKVKWGNNTIVDTTLTSTSGIYVSWSELSALGTVTINGKEYCFIRYYGTEDKEDFANWSVYANGVASRPKLDFDGGAAQNIFKTAYIFLHGIFEIPNSVGSYIAAPFRQLKQIYLTTESALVSGATTTVSAIAACNYLNLIECEDDTIKFFRTSGINNVGFYIFHPYNVSVVCYPSNWVFYGTSWGSWANMARPCTVYIKSDTLKVNVIADNITSVPNVVTQLLNALSYPRNAKNYIILYPQTGTTLTAAPLISNIKKVVWAYWKNTNLTATIGIGGNYSNSPVNNANDGAEEIQILSMETLDTAMNVYMPSAHLKKVIFPVGFSAKTIYINYNLSFGLEGILGILNSIASTTTYTHTRIIYMNSGEYNISESNYVKLSDGIYVPATANETNAITILEAFANKNWTITVANSSS